MITGIDCSKDSLDVAIIEGDKPKFLDKYLNSIKGFEKLYRSIKSSELIVMEATGPYYLPVASFLKKKGLPVSVVNPLVIKRFCQMSLSRAKTDKKDAILIARYGQSQKPALWEAPSDELLHVQQLETYLEGLKKRKTMVSNQLHAFEHTGKLGNTLKKQLDKELEEYEEKISQTEKEIKEQLGQEQGDMLNNLISIPGIGERSACLLTITTNGFKDFECYKQLISYYGLAPRIFESGSSVRGKAHICKMGMSQVRKTLYMAAKSALRYNKTCKSLYERLRAKGKAYKVALIAVVNKLIKQAFAIAKSGIPYRSDFAEA